MKKIIFLFLLLSAAEIISAQSIGIGTEDPNVNSILDIRSNNKGLLIPRVTAVERLAMSVSIPASGIDTDGMMIFDINDHKFYFWDQDNTTWKELGGGGTGWLLNGNVGTDANVDFLGTTDAEDLSFKVNDVEKIRLLQNGTLAFKNTGNSIFIGENAGVLDDLTNNKNVFIGDDSGASITTGRENVAVGYNTMSNSSTASYTTALGFEAAKNTVGFLNVAIGKGALSSNVSGARNVAVGSNALGHSFHRKCNTSIGSGAGGLMANSDSCVFVGANATVNIGDAQYNNSIAIGTGATITAAHQTRIGTPSMQSIGGYQDWTNVSDQRFKTNIQENVPGLDFILKLKPVTYNLDLGKLNGFLRKQEDKARVSKQIYSGFLAQDVALTAEDIGYNFSGIDKPKNADDHYGLRYATFVVPLVKSIQELSEENRHLSEELAVLKVEVAKIKAFLSSN